MAKNIEPKLKKIGEYLTLKKDTAFIIPEYQRAYSWETDNCDKLWQDIVNYIDVDSNDNYFFGTIIINCQDDDTKLALIDGQQRTTTFILLLKALLICTNDAIRNMENDDESKSLCRGLKERRRRIMGILYKTETEDISDEPDEDRDEEIYINSNIILENNSINEKYKEELKTILNAVNYVDAEKRVFKAPRKQKDNKYTNYFRNFKYFYYKIRDLTESELNKYAKTIIDSCEVIEIKSWQVEQAITMFNSLNSDGLPLYDSDIISAKLYATADKNGIQDKFKASWKELLDLIEKLDEAELGDIDSILMQQMYYERTIEKEIITDTGSINVTTPGLRRYFTEINKNILNKPIELCEKMINLAKIWIKISNYTIVQVLLMFNENSKLFLASYFYRFKEEDVTEKKLTIVLESMLRLFSILEVVDAGYSSKFFKSFLFEENIKLADKSIKENEIKKDFVEHIKKSWTRETLKEAIIDCDSHALVYLNEYLLAKENKSKFSIGVKHDIEHIMPYSGYNRQEIRKDANIDDEEEFWYYVNQLGNKILLEEKINRSISNNWFRTKVSTKLEDKTGYVDSNYPMAKLLVQTYKNTKKPFWKKKDISNATNIAAERIVKFIFDE